MMIEERKGLLVGQLKLPGKYRQNASIPRDTEYGRDERGDLSVAVVHHGPPALSRATQAISPGAAHAKNAGKERCWGSVAGDRG